MPRPYKGTGFPGLFLQPQHGQERLLRHLDRADLLHSLLAFLLLLQELPLARDVAAVALGQHVLAQRLDRFPGDDAAADGGLDRDLEQLARDQLAQLVDTARARARRRGPGG